MKYLPVATVCLLAVIVAVSADDSQHFGAQQVQHRFRRPPFRPQSPYPQRRQSSGLTRARQAMTGFMQRIVAAGRRFRRMASARLFAAFNRRSLRRSQPNRQRRPFRQ